MCVIVHNEVYRLPVANYPDEVLSNCITEIFEYFYEEGFGGVEQSDFTRLQEEADMADELVFSAGEIVYAMSQLPKVTSVSLNGSAVLVGFKDAPDGGRSSLILTLRLKRLRSSTMNLQPLAGSSRAR